MNIKVPRGTQDILPADSLSWTLAEDTARDISSLYGYFEIRTPAFEDTSLFARGVGGSTDIVEKEMYTFIDKGGRSVTLRPEGTASVVRAYIEHKIDPANIWKVFYLGPFFRYERPQSGRFRQHYQFGIEAIGSMDPAVDLEVIKLSLDFFQRLGLKELQADINSIGCLRCRPLYIEKLKDYFKKYLSLICENCQKRLDKNPLRILDCKAAPCKEKALNSPKSLDFLCAECSDHFTVLKRYLNELKITFNENPMLVRGLDYYTKTVFEIISKSLGAQNSVCGGGRYDNLVRLLGGREVPAAGFALGLERTIMILEKEVFNFEKYRRQKVFIVTFDENCKERMLKLLYKLRGRGISCEVDYSGRSFKAQLKQADKFNADWVIIIGEDELRENYFTLKDMKQGFQLKLSEDELIEKLGGEVL